MDNTLSGYPPSRTEAEESKNRNKARILSIAIMLFFLIFWFIPFMKKYQKPKVFEERILIQFQEELPMKKASLEKSSTKAAKGKKSPKKSKKKADKPKKTKAQPKTESKPNPVTDAKPIPTKSKPVLTAPESTTSISSLLAEVSDNVKVEEATPEVTEVTAPLGDDFLSDLAEELGGGTSGSGSGGKSNSGSGKGESADSGSGSDRGEGSSGNSDTGDSDTDGSSDSGDGEDFDGEGLLSRKVVYRANLDGIIKENGVIVINLCVNRDGKVVYTQIDESLSTISDSKLLEKAESTASKYRYEKDYTVAQKQCGKLSFIVKIEE